MSSLPDVLVRLPDRLEDDAEGGANEGRAALERELEQLAELQALLGVKFSRVALLRVALTVGSWANENRSSGWPSNASLEFFGDAVLDLVAADAVWRMFPDLGEGPLTRLRASLVSEASLAAAARQLDLGRWLYVGRGDDQRGAREREGTLADALEAVIGAVFLDARESGGDPIGAAGNLFLHLFAKRLRLLAPDDGLDAKSRLQQIVQARHRVTPAYRSVGEPPPPEAPFWRARVEIPTDGGSTRTLGEGSGRSLREAERGAAVDALRKFDDGSD